MRREATVDREGYADHEAGAGAAEPKNRCRDLIRAAQSPDRLILDLLHGVSLRIEHVCDHRRVDGPRAHGVDADASGGIFEGRALGEADHAVLARVIRGTAWQAQETAERGAVHDRAAALLAHLAELVLHGCPD